MEQPSCDATDYKAVYATTQPMLEPPSALMGMEPTGSESGASGEMGSEKYVAKKSINVCQIKMVRGTLWCDCARVGVCVVLGECTFQVVWMHQHHQTLYLLLYMEEVLTGDTSA